MTWEDELTGFANRYSAGLEAVKRRRAAWDPAVVQVLLPTLQSAAEFLRKKGMAGACAKRRSFGENVESVQLYLGQVDTLIRWDPSTSKDSNPFVSEVGATLGYSLQFDGRVSRWFREHWFSATPRAHPSMKHIETIEDVSVLESERVKRHVTDFLSDALETSFRRESASRGPIGFCPEPKWEEP